MIIKKLVEYFKTTNYKAIEEDLKTFSNNSINDFYNNVVNKYYTPDVSELHLGFECEVFEINARKWVTFKIVTTEDLKKLINNIKVVRVKYLDEQDIEELDYERHHEFKNEFHNEEDDYITYIIQKHNTTKCITIIEKDTYDNMGLPKTNILCHSVRIKNKTELIKLLKQLDIY